MAIEIVQRRSAQPIHVVAEIGVGEIALQDLVLGQPGFQPEGDQRLPRLARQRLFGGEEGELGQLLRDGGAAAHAGESSARHAARVHAPMAVEPPVLDGEEGLDHVIGQVGHLHRFFHHGAVASNGRPVGRQQGDLRRSDRLQALGKRRGDRQPGDQHDQHHQQRGHDPAGPPQHAPPARAFRHEAPPPAPIAQAVIVPLGRSAIIEVVVVDGGKRRPRRVFQRQVPLGPPLRFRLSPREWIAPHAIHISVLA